MKKDKILNIIALFLALILICLSSYRIYEYMFLDDDIDINEKENDNNSNNETVEIDKDKLFDYVKGKNLPEVAEEITLVNTLTNNQKFEYLFDYISKKALTNGDYLEISEENIKTEYETLFGKNSYVSLSEFTVYCHNYKYYENERIYKALIKGGCGGNAYIGSYEEKIIDLKEYDDRIEIISARGYIFRPTKSVYYSMEDYLNGSSPIAQPNNDYSDDYIDNLIIDNKDRLSQFIYTFKLNENNSYYYDSVKRIS